MAVLLVIFLAGLHRLLVMRFETGDAYPVYSSLRADPLGTKIFFDSLAESGLEVRRNYRPDNSLSQPKGKTFFFIGVRRYAFDVPETESRQLDNAVAGGGRIVVMMFPEGPAEASTESKGEKHAQENGSTNENKDLYAQKLVDLPEHWGFKISNAEAGVSAGAGASGTSGPANPSLSGSGKATTAGVASGVPGLPEIVSWHSGIFFTDCIKEWKTLYEANGRPVMMVRRVGSGEIVVASDSYLVSNEAMFAERHADLLSFLVGSSAEAVFNESHLGLTRNPGVMTLLMKYHLWGLMAGLFLLGALFMWKSSFSLVPPVSDADKEAESIRGMDNVSGLVNLLKRNIPPAGLLEACYTEWKKTHSNNPRFTRQRDLAVQAVIRQEKLLPSRKRDPVRAYEAIEKILSERGQGT